MTKTIFDKPWFTWHALAGLRAQIHAPSKTHEHQHAIVLQLLSTLLYEPDSLPSVRQAADFVALCKQEGSRSFAQIYQDLWVLLMTQQKRNGFFVEFGACDGATLSNTLLLERDYGWTGILAEPNPVWHERLAQERQCHISHLCVHTKSGQELQFEAVTQMPELSRVATIVPDDVHERNGNRKTSTTFDVKTISLLDLLDQHNAPKRIDYLSIDTEGSEFEILNAFDFNRYQFALLTVEHAGESAKREAIHTLLEGQGYQRWFTEMSRWDDWYIGPQPVETSA